MSGTILPTITHTGQQPIYGIGGGSNVPSGNVSSLYGYDTYTLYSSSFSDNTIQIDLANNYNDIIFKSDGSNYSRITSSDNGLNLESY